MLHINSKHKLTGCCNTRSVITESDCWENCCRATMQDQSIDQVFGFRE